MSPVKEREQRIIIAGSGGQGILFLGRVISYAAMLAGKEVTWFPAYGAEMRGGTANCTVIISDTMIGSPVVRNPDTLIVMNDASYQRFSERLLTGGLMIYDSSLITSKTHREDIRLLPAPASELSAAIGSTKSANMVMVGVFIAAHNVLSLDTVLAALDEMTPEGRKHTLEANKNLIRKGHDLVENTKGKDIGYQAYP
jgi:2-oxoglutarate ferredoxin oxidoreductase subunit gamma